MQFKAFTSYRINGHEELFVSLQMLEQASWRGGQSPGLTVFKGHLDNAFNNTLKLSVSPEWVRQLDCMAIVGPLQLKYSIPFHILIVSATIIYKSNNLFKGKYFELS